MLIPKLDPLPPAPQPRPEEQFTSPGWQRWLLTLAQAVKSLQRSLLFDSAGTASAKLSSGSGTTDVNGLLTVTFPTAFGAVPTVTATTVGGSAGAASSVASVFSPSISQVQIYSRNQTGALVGNIGINWIAVGTTQ